MAKFKILVVGDSFALLDKKHSHWARIWANKLGGETEHLAFSGGSHVTIVNHAVTVKPDLREYAGVMYFITDVFRLEGSDHSLKPADAPYNDHNAIDALLRLNDYKHSNHIRDWENALNWEQHHPPLDWVQAYSSYSAMPNQYREHRVPTALYDNISLRWLAAANVTALRFYAQYCKLQHIPFIGINSAWEQGIDVIKRLTPFNTWLMTTTGEHRSQINYSLCSSANHVDVDIAVNMSKRFAATAYAEGLFPIVTEPAEDSNRNE